jgi:hypothetical protein
MLEKWAPITKDMKDLEKTLELYKKSFPDNPAMSSTGKKKEKIKKQ